MVAGACYDLVGADAGLVDAGACAGAVAYDLGGVGVGYGTGVGVGLVGAVDHACIAGHTFGHGGHGGHACGVVVACVVAAACVVVGPAGGAAGCS